MAKPRKADPFNRTSGVYLEWGPEKSIDVRERNATFLYHEARYSAWRGGYR
jgi:hypothetical protein